MNIAPLALLGFSFLPIWKSGLRKNMNLWQFVIGHTTLSPWESLYVPEEYATRTITRKCG